MMLGEELQQHQDWVDLAPLQSVIRLGDAAQFDEVMEGFVWTEDIIQNLSAFATMLEQNKGGGVFLRGHYGSGKSHLLSFIGGDAVGWARLQQQVSARSLPSLLPISLSLIQWPASRSLESLVEEVCLEMGLSGDTMLPRGEVWNSRAVELKRRDMAGVILLFDELSEFLRSKASSAELSEDLRYLQFLGEYCAGSGSWVIGAIQEEIEGVGAISRETSLKLKDRFPYRWVLSERHLHQILPLRLLRRKPGSEEKLAVFIDTLEANWPSINIDLGKARQVFPLHLGTANLLSGLGSLFSEHRGALAFTRDMMRGNWTEKVQPFLERPITQRITADYLFDYFADRLKELPRLREYAVIVWPHIEQRCRELIAPLDLDYALKASKILLVASLDPVYNGLTSRELAWMCGDSLGGEEDASISYLENLILKTLLGRCNHLGRDQEGRWRIDRQEQGWERFQRILEEKVDALRPQSAQVLEQWMKFLDRPPFAFASLYQGRNKLGWVQWLNTPRKLNLLWGVGEEKCDIRILCPGDSVPDQEDCLLWAPATLSDVQERELMLAAATMLLAEEQQGTSEEIQAGREAVERMTQESGRWRQMLETMYRDGYWLLNGQQLKLPSQWTQARHLEEMLEDPVFELLSRRHGDFAMIAPRTPLLSERMISDMIQGWMIAGHGRESELKKNGLLEMVQSLARPLGLASKKQSSWLAVWDASCSLPVRVMEEELRRHDGRLEPVISHLSQGSLGLPPILIQLMVWSAVAQGAWRAMRQGTEVPVSKLSFHNLDSLDQLQPSPALRFEQLDDLLLLPLVEDISPDLSLHAMQREVTARLDKRVHEAEKLQSRLQLIKLHPVWQGSAQLVEEYTLAYQPFAEYCALEAQPSDFERALYFWQARQSLANLDEKMEQVKEWLKIMDRFGDHLQKNAEYLQDDFFSQLEGYENIDSLLRDRDDLLRSLADAELICSESSLQRWLAASDQWRSRWCSFYIYEHHQVQHAQMEMDARDFYERIACDPLGKQMLQDSWSDRCSAKTDHEVQQRPFCRCNFSPSQMLPDKKDQCWQSLRKYMDVLGLDSSGIESIRVCYEQGKWLELKSEWKRLLQKKETTQPAKVKTVSIQSFFNLIQGKTMSREEATRQFDQWLRNEIGDSASFILR